MGDLSIQFEQPKPPNLSIEKDANGRVINMGGKGTKGDKGDKGDTGLQGAKGDKGDDGLSAYEIAVVDGFVGTEEQWLLSLKGEKGDKGDTGLQGAKGDKGDKGDTGASGLMFKTDWNATVGSDSELLNKPTDLVHETRKINNSALSSDIVIDKLYSPDGEDVVAYTDNAKNLFVDGNIIQQGTAYQTHAEELFTKKDIVVTRDGAVAGLAIGEITGMRAKIYDGVHDGMLGFDRDGIARVGDEGELQPLATREEAPIDGGIAYWDALTFKFKTLATTFKTNWDNAWTWVNTNGANVLNLLSIKQPIFTGICETTPITINDISINYATRVLTITPPLGYFHYYTDGNGVPVKHTVTGAVSFPAFANTSGEWFFYFNGDTATTSQTSWWTISETSCSIFRILWNASKVVDSEKAIETYFEAHLNTQHNLSHAWQHKYGAIYMSGLDIISNPLASGSPNADGRNTVIALSSGACQDDNLYYRVTNTNTPTSATDQDLGTTVAGSLNATNSALLKILGKTTLGNDIIPATRFPFLWNASSNIPEYLDANGVRQPITNNNFFVVFVFSVQDLRLGTIIKAVPSYGQYTNITNARAVAWETVAVSDPNLLDTEKRPLYRCIYEHRTSYSAGCKYAVLRERQDIRKNAISQTTTATGLVNASSVVVVPSGNITSTNGQSALEELDTEKQPNLTSSGTGSAIFLPTGNKIRSIIVTGEGAITATESGDSLTIDINDQYYKRYKGVAIREIGSVGCAGYGSNLEDGICLTNSTYQVDDTLDGKGTGASLFTTTFNAGGGGDASTLGATVYKCVTAGAYNVFGIMMTTGITFDSGSTLELRVRRYNGAGVKQETLMLGRDFARNTGVQYLIAQGLRTLTCEANDGLVLICVAKRIVGSVLQATIPINLDPMYKGRFEITRI